MNTIHVRRRRLLQLMAGAVVVVAIQPTGYLFDWLNRQESPAAPWLALFSRQESVRIIGQAYLQVNAQEADFQWLLDQITLDVTGRSGSDAHGDELSALLRQRIRRDFADEKVVKLNGWILSTTEARLCALAAMAAEPRSTV